MNVFSIDEKMAPQSSLWSVMPGNWLQLPEIASVLLATLVVIGTLLPVTQSSLGN
jgi:hypothetical protein